MSNKKFNDFHYVRPDVLTTINNLEALFKDFSKRTLEEKIKIINKMFQQDDYISSNASLAHIRYTQNVKDEQYSFEMKYLDREMPKLAPIYKKVASIILKDKDLDNLKKHFGSLYFKQLELDYKTTSKEIIPYLQEENKLVTEYEELLATAKIEFDGKVLNLQEFGPYFESTKRSVRKNAMLAYSNFFLKNNEKIGTIYDKLVKVRTNKARTLGYKNYVEMAYDLLGRTDYTAKDVAKYRKQILKVVVPIANKLVKEQGERIGIPSPLAYDLAIQFKDGNPIPKGTYEGIINNTKIMYEELSPETGKAFNMMKERELLDLVARKNKSGGGYCSYLPIFEAPFIFANFNGTQGDVETLTHEMGHAFQIYKSRENISPYRWPTMEAAEIFSMSMEFLTWPWMKLFFKEDTKKFRYRHLAGSIKFLPYGALIDHFQEEVYKKPNMTINERNELFRKLEKKYLPYKNYQGIPAYERGLFWYRQGHIFSVPFYYIDYTLAQVCAFQFLKLSKENPTLAFLKYLHMAQIGGSKPFLELLDEGTLINPFKKGSIKKIIKPLLGYLKDENF